MPVTIVKQKPQEHVASQQVEVQALSEVVDQYGELQERQAELKAELKALESEMAKVRKPIDLEMAEANPEQGYVISGGKYRMDITKCTAQNEWTDLKGLYNALEEVSPGLFLEISKPSVTETRKYLGEFGIKKFLDVNHTGKRRVTTKVTDEG